jgi:DNA topoisomerase-1
MRLVIVESPKKARTIQGMLGGGYKVTASMGHVRDLPPKDLGVDLQRDFAPQYVTLPRAQAALSSLRKAVAGAESVLLATDPDREGEAIAWHLAQALRLAKARYRRITFHEISRRAIQDALAHPRDLDPHLIDAQQARRVLDRLVGYQLSPLLWRKVQRGTSAGRVQSVAVKLVVDREREIQAFVPAEYWTIDVLLSTVALGGPHPPAPSPNEGEGERPTANQTFLARLQEVDGKKADIPNAEVAHALEAQLRAAAYAVRETGQKTLTRNPFPPFTTSTLQQAAGNRLRLTAKKTMGAAQALYEAGLVTYMRTDSVSVSAAAIAQARDVIAAEFGPQYVPDAPRRYTTKAKNAQEAHEAIRPVDLRKVPAALRATLAPDEWRVYDLIWKRMIASQMPPARYLQDVALIDGVHAETSPRHPLRGSPAPRDGEGSVDSPPTVVEPDQPPSTADHTPPSRLGGGAGGVGPPTRFLLKAQATTLVFPGWLAAYGEEPAQQATSAQPAQRSRRGRMPSEGSAEGGDQDDAPANDRLPELVAGQPLAAEDVLPAQHFTQPPRRYTEASLVKALEDAGVGRPSTYATVVSTVQDRGYVQLEQRHFVPTELGFAANDFLVANFPKIVDLPFTAEMEDSLDEIAAGRLLWTQMLHAFYGPFAETVTRATTAAVTALKQREPRASTAAALPAAGSPPPRPQGAARRGTRARRPTTSEQSQWNERPPAGSAGRRETRPSASADAGQSPGQRGRAARLPVSSANPDGGWLWSPDEEASPPTSPQRRTPRSAAPASGLAAPPVPPRTSAPRRPAPEDGAGASAPSGAETAQPLCPQCGKPLTLRTSQYGPFLGCSGFPACRYIQREHREQPPARPAARRRARSSRPPSGGPPSALTKNVVRRRGRSD